ncbi:CRISPR-associated protein, Csy4 family [Maridesulfovibrio ferrireducens]|uniref:CRISPR-associated protein, Csy4 family n=1 Tax=Maridesulfovibrio ferrireducens TaxID=246191 RepID=A0A1G9KXE2_9BACT|nr:type I-F CRISPR-associated endoribonuclease Cas6/Csy4 [Maridesulfovibrio ferrireducens]SDL54214.1 CRISPR-associated protein, Csy4 family [Maridesulfovibrio ferrireducens]
MDHYFNITIKPDAEMRENVLMNKVYTKLHKALFSLKSDGIGVSFPSYRLKLGRELRIHGAIASLNDLQKLDWIGGLVGYCDISAVSIIPENCQYRVISRKQANMTRSKLNRLIRRESISGDQIKEYKAKMFSKGIANPYFELESESNGHKHRRYIQFGETSSVPVHGKFDFFGLSKTATVPWF